MKRQDREVTDFNEIYDILNRSQTVHLGLFNQDYPYVVPLSFGLAHEADKLIVYVHGAKQGLKHELIAQNNNVCVQADILHKYGETAHGVTSFYESVIAFGEICEVTGQEVEKGLNLILSHCEHEGIKFDINAIKATTVYKITCKKITGKRNI